MRVTACICTRDRPQYVRDCLEGLRCQTVAPAQFDILVVDSASGDAAAAELARLVAGLPNARLLRLDQPGVSAARNAGAHAAAGEFLGFLDDDAIPAPDWIERILQVLAEADPLPAAIGGRILPRWEAPLPVWWPRRLRGVLSIIETEGCGEFRTPELPAGLEPYAANMVVQIQPMLALGGFSPEVGRFANSLLSDEEVLLAWKLQDAGYSVRYDSRIVVQHQIQAVRLTPGWLLSRLYWQGISTVLSRRQLGRPDAVWRELPRRLAVAGLLGPSLLVPRHSTWAISGRWRVAYALGFIRAAFGIPPGNAVAC